jgi:hypothetical protein
MLVSGTIACMYIYRRVAMENERLDVYVTVDLNERLDAYVIVDLLLIPVPLVSYSLLIS